MITLMTVCLVLVPGKYKETLRGARFGPPRGLPAAKYFLHIKERCLACCTSYPEPDGGNLWGIWLTVLKTLSLSYPANDVKSIEHKTESCITERVQSSCVLSTVNFQR